MAGSKGLMAKIWGGGAVGGGGCSPRAVDMDSMHNITSQG